MPFQRKTLEWVQAGHNPETIPQGASSVGQGYLGQEGQASGSPTWGKPCQALSEGESGPTPELYIQSLPQSKPSSPRRSNCRFSLGTAIRPPCGSKLIRAELSELKRQTKRISLWGWDWPVCSGARMCPAFPPGSCTTLCPPESWTEPPRETGSEGPTQVLLVSDLEDYRCE